MPRRLMRNRDEKREPRTKNVAIIGAKGIPPEFPGTSGVEFYIAQKIANLIKQRVNVSCYVRGWATPKHTTQYRGARLIHTPSLSIKRLDALSHSFASTVHACFSQVDTVWYHASGPSLFACIPILFRKRVHVTIHTLEWKRKTWGPAARTMLRLGEWVGVKSAHKLFVVSKALAQYIYETYDRQVIVDEPTQYKTRHAPPNIIKNRYGLTGNDYILYLGRFVEEKRLEWLIRAYTKNHPKGMRLVIAGGEGYGNVYENKIRLSARTNRDIVFAGWVFGKEKEELLENCFLFALPSSVEGNPIVLHELSAHVRVVIPDSLSEIWSHKNNAYVFRSDSETDFRRQLKNAMTHK